MDDAGAGLNSILVGQPELKLSQIVRGITGANALQEPQNTLIGIVGGAAGPTKVILGRTHFMVLSVQFHSHFIHIEVIFKFH